MKILLDTHIILWALNGSDELTEDTRTLISEPSNDVYYSVASLWEVTIKHIAHPNQMLISGSQLSDRCKKMGFVLLPIHEMHVKGLEDLKLASSAKPHNDPFDRLLLAQAKTEGMKFVTHDSLIPGYNEECVLSV